MQIASPRFGTGLLPSPGALVGIGVAVAIITGTGFLINQRLNPSAATGADADRESNPEHDHSGRQRDRRCRIDEHRSPRV